MAKILLHTLLFPPDANSNAYVFADLAKELRAIGHEIVVLTTTPHYNLVEEDLRKQPMTPVCGSWLLRSEFEGITCYHVQVPPGKGGILTRVKTAIRFHILGFIAAMSKAFECDIVLSQSPPLSIGLLSSWIARRHGARSVYIAQDIFPDGLIKQGKIRNPVAIRFLRWLERRVYSASDAVCSVSDGLVNTLRPRVPQHTLLRSIPNFVDSLLYRPLPRRNEFSTAHGLDEVFAVSYLGNLGNAQNFEPVMTAAAALQGQPIKFLLAGGGIKFDQLVREASAKQLGNLEILGYQPRETTPLINASSDLCLVLLSAHVENFSFPSKVYTLMACGKPILLYGNPGADVARFILDARIGWVIPEGDTRAFIERIKELAEDRGTLDEYGQRALCLARARFTARAVATQYGQLFADLLSSEGRVR
jgi:glycosyltransferase involved in cell wall biosynthesis